MTSGRATAIRSSQWTAASKHFRLDEGVNTSANCLLVNHPQGQLTVNSKGHPQGQPTASRERKHFQELFTRQDGITILIIITPGGGGRRGRPTLETPIMNQRRPTQMAGAAHRPLPTALDPKFWPGGAPGGGLHRCALTLERGRPLRQPGT